MNFIKEIGPDSFIDFPFKATQKDYDAAVHFLVSSWQSLARKPLSIYQIGQVGVPGISDLDFVVVYSRGEPVDRKQFEPGNFPEWVQKLMTHSPYFCLESDWPFLRAWYPAFNLKYLWGRSLPKPEMPSEYLSGCALGMLVDYLIVKVPRDFLAIIWERPLRVRILLAMLHSLKYTLKLAEDAHIDLPANAYGVTSDIDELRKNWLELDDALRMKTLFSLCESACNVTGELIKNVDKKISGSVPECKAPLPSDRKKNDGEFLFNFKSNWDYSEVLEQTIKNYHPSRESDWVNPESFLHVLSIYADECPDFGKYLKAQGCVIPFDWNGGIWDKGLRYHARAMQAYAENLVKLGIPSQKYVALGYSPAPLKRISLKERIIRLIK